MNWERPSAETENENFTKYMRYRIGGEMALDVTVEKIGKKYNRLDIIHDGIVIGEYERSIDAHILRKKKEISNAEIELLRIFRNHGFFIVRWDGSGKAVSIDGNFLEYIHEKYWKGLR